MQKRRVNKPPARHRARAARETAVLYALVALGTAIGGTLRAACALAAAGEAFPWAFPWATLFVNVAGSLAIGFYATLTGPDGRVLAGPRQRHFVMTGLCGGFTTFSVFSLEALRLLQAGSPGAAALLVAVSAAAWLAAVWLGDRLAMRLNNRGGA